MKILLKLNDDTEMVEMWTKISSQPALMSVSHRDCFDPEILKIMDQDDDNYAMNGQAFAEITLVESIGWSFAK